MTPEWIHKVFGFMLEQPLHKTLVQMRILPVSFFCLAIWFSIDAWGYMKEYAIQHPDAPWLVGAMPSFIAANIGGLWAMVAEARKSHGGSDA